MSRLFRESSEKPYRKGLIASIFYFLVWLICYSVGYAIGVIALLLGFTDSVKRAIMWFNRRGVEVDMEEEIRKMNDQGPNN